MTACQYTLTKPTAAPSQNKRSVLFCRCLDCQDARAMNAGKQLHLRRSVRERLAALQWKPDETPTEGETA